MARPIEKESFIEIPWDLLSFRGEFSQATEFTPFPRLPPEIRCKIWRAACTPRCLPGSLFEARRVWDGKGYRRPVAPLPATARVNQEAREETLKVYSEIPSAPLWKMIGFINYEVDTMRFSCYNLACPASIYPATLLKNLQRITIIPRCWIYGCEPEQAKLKSIDNFLQYVAAKHFPSLRELDIGIPSKMEHGRQSFLSAHRRTAHGMSRSIRPLFLRMTNGSGMQFLPTTNYWGGWDAIKILIMEEDEAARFGGGENRSKHQDFLDYIGLCLWHVFEAGLFLAEDLDISQLMGNLHVS